MKKQEDIRKDQIRHWLTTDDGQLPGEAEVADTEEALLRFAEAHAQVPPPLLRDHILQKITTLNQQKKERQALDLQQLPLLEAASNWLDWQAAVAGITPPDDFSDLHLHELESNDQRDLFVIWAREIVEEEIHEDLLESFLILEGACECHITDTAGNTRIVHLRSGDFLTLPLGETHDLRITSLQPAKAILQRLKLTA